MAKFGSAGLIHTDGLNRDLDGVIPSYNKQVAAGLRKDGSWARMRHLAEVNYAHVYTHWIRRYSNEADYLARARRIERRIVQPFHFQKTRTERAEKWDKLDYHVERGVVPVAHVEGLRDDLFSQPVYYDPYIIGLKIDTLEEARRRPFLYMDSQTLFENPHFLNICANPEIIAFCREALGPGAALTWAWSWISNPNTGAGYQNQNWHRDNNEPLNYVRIFVPMANIAGPEDGPTVLIPGSSQSRDFREVRRFRDEEVADLQNRHGVGMIPAEIGDVYFVNTMAMHRGLPPMKQRSVLSLLVSLSPSNRTPFAIKQKVRDLPESVREVVAKNRRFFRYFFD